jgi:hypothetical protein
MTDTDLLPAKRPIDWESIEREYRAGRLSVVEIGRIYGCSHTAVNKRAKKFDWKRDLAARVRQEVSSRLVSDEVSTASLNETIAEAAERVVQIVREHRKDIGAGRLIVRDLFAELAEAGEWREEVEDVILAETGDDVRAGRRTSMMRAVSLPSRAGIALSLSSALKNLIALERRAFGLQGDDEGQDGGPVFALTAPAGLTEDKFAEIAKKLAAEI